MVLSKNVFLPIDSFLKQNSGHCPNHEAPQAIGQLVRNWVNAEERRKESLKLVVEDGADKQVFHEPWGAVTIQEQEAEDIELSLYDWLAVTFV